MTAIKSYDREQARRLNRAIDEALRDPHAHDASALRKLAGAPPPAELAERVRRRAARCGGRVVAGLPERPDALIAAIYALAAPRGWFNAWCDGSVRDARASLGIVLMDPRGRVVTRAVRDIASGDTFATEIAALEASLQAALDAGASLRVHTDCAALVQLWCARRPDPRLGRVRSLARRFRGLHIRAVPRGHNEAAHALARAALQLDDAGGC